jgi:hypothetical protein
MLNTSIMTQLGQVMQMGSDVVKSESVALRQSLRALRSPPSPSLAARPRQQQTCALTLSPPLRPPGVPFSRARQWRARP